MNNVQHIESLNPQKVHLFKELIRLAKDECGYDTIITQSYRTIAKSNEFHDLNPKNAKGGLSAHNYGFAIDCNFVKNRIHLMKATDKEIWLMSGIPQIAVELGLRWGGDFSTYYDPIHFDCLNDSKSTARWFAYLKTTYADNYETVATNRINWKF